MTARPKNITSPRAKATGPRGDASSAILRALDASSVIGDVADSAPDDRDAELVPLDEARRIARRAGSREERVPLADHPQGRQLLDAVAQAERMTEHLRAFLIASSRGVGDRASLAVMRKQAADITAMWLALTRKRSTGDELAMRFLDAISLAMQLPAAEQCARASEIVLSRIPSARVSAETYADAIDLWRAPRKDWTRIRSLIARKVTKDVPSSPEAMRVKYSEWRARRGKRAAARKSTA